MKVLTALADTFDPPFQDVAHRRLPGLNAEVARQDRARDDPADAGDVFKMACGDGAVTGRGADDLDECAFLDTRSDGAGVRVEPTRRPRDAVAQPDLPGPLRGQRARRCAGR